MPIRPIDVRRKEFRNGFRGYDANQVDDFLDAVADEFERTYTENARLREEISSLRERLQQFEELEGSIRSALVHAEQAANDLRRTATWEAEDVRKSAAREADLTVREAQARAHQMLAESSARVERIQESYEALQEAKRTFTNDFRQLLKTYTEVMDSMEISSAREIEASLRERLDTESIAVAREAASHESAEHTAPEPEDTQRIDAEPTEGVVAEAASAEDDAATQSIEPETAEPAPGEIAELEATEPEIESSTSEEPPAQTFTGDLGAAPEPREEPAAVDELARTDEPAAEEVDSEEPTLAEERSSENFFDREGGGGSSQEGESESRIFRASRFLRRRE
ncbi:MAG: DivIVA [Rubrobacteraceae bacterium]|jgi:cell division initiation protein|nr:DivIVA [Rubrobacteraceae bacterium]